MVLSMKENCMFNGVCSRLDATSWSCAIQLECLEYGIEGISKIGWW